MNNGLRLAAVYLLSFNLVNNVLSLDARQHSITVEFFLWKTKTEPRQR